MEPEVNANEKLDLSQMWEGMFYLSFFILATLVVIPNLPKQYTFNLYYPIAMVIYGSIGVFAGIGVYRLVKHTGDWLKWGIVIAIYTAVIYQLITHVERFAVPDM